MSVQLRVRLCDSDLQLGRLQAAAGDKWAETKEEAYISITLSANTCCESDVDATACIPILSGGPTAPYSVLKASTYHAPAPTARVHFKACVTVKNASGTRCKQQLGIASVRIAQARAQPAHTLTVACPRNGAVGTLAVEVVVDEYPRLQPAASALPWHMGPVVQSTAKMSYNACREGLASYFDGTVVASDSRLHALHCPSFYVDANKTQMPSGWFFSQRPVCSASETHMQAALRRGLLQANLAATDVQRIIAEAEADPAVPHPRLCAVEGVLVGMLTAPVNSYGYMVDHGFRGGGVATAEAPLARECWCWSGGEAGGLKQGGGDCEVLFFRLPLKT